MESCEGRQNRDFAPEDDFLDDVDGRRLGSLLEAEEVDGLDAVDRGDRGWYAEDEEDLLHVGLGWKERRDWAGWLMPIFFAVSRALTR